MQGPVALEVRGVRQRRSQWQCLLLRDRRDSQPFTFPQARRRLYGNHGVFFRKRLHCGHAGGGVFRGACAEQVTERTRPPETDGFLAPVQSRRPDPHGVTGARQRHIEQTQIFLLPLLIRRLEGGGIGRQFQPTHGDAILHHSGAHELRTACGHWPVMRGKRQHHHGVLEALGLVDSDDTHQFGIAFQPQQLRVIRSAHRGIGLAIGDLQRQPMDLRGFPFHSLADGLQQFAQLQHIGEATLTQTICGGQPTARHAKQVEGFPDHRQNAPRLPDLLQIAQAAARSIERFFIHCQPLQFRETTTHQRCRQSSTSQPCLAWRGDGLQQTEQVRSFGRGKNGVILGEVSGLYSLAPQFAAHGGRLDPGTDENHDVRRPQPAYGRRCP